MYTVYGEKAALPDGQVAVRDPFQHVTSFSHVTQLTSGTVTIQPSGLILRVSANGADYQRVRIVDAEGQLVGMLACSTGGMVTWITPIPTATP